LFRGFNGADKTSLVSAVCWCLTGLGLRSQGLPAPLHDCIAVRVADASSAQAGFEIPMIVPVEVQTWRIQHGCFRDARLKLLARRLVYFERPALLEADLRVRIEAAVSGAQSNRLRSTDLRYWALIGEGDGV
jgi:hypothetical protein